MWLLSTGRIYRYPSALRHCQYFNIVRSIIHQQTDIVYCIQLCHHWNINFYIKWTSIQTICWVSVLTKSPNIQKDMCVLLKITTQICFMKVLKGMPNTKHYNNVFGNHVPMISECFENWSYLRKHWRFIHFETVHQSNWQHCKRTPLFLHKRPDRYNAVVPLSIEPLWQNGHAHVNDALNSDNVYDRPNLLLLNSSPLDGSSSLDGENSNSSSSDNSSFLDDGQSDDVPDFLYRLQMHRKAHPTN